jgi:hypothetical protein
MCWRSGIAFYPVVVNKNLIQDQQGKSFFHIEDSIFSRVDIVNLDLYRFVEPKDRSHFGISIFFLVVIIIDDLISWLRLVAIADHHSGT